ncbi:MAG TPA: tRNA pseudouridine(55) synthase TruB [Solirubrobacteraceae bacterium]|nr:tRNA pseudouridine(55) synthase TruB [Solirubrobacteraceae bacterium]
MDGLVLADKPAGKTSHDVTTLVRRELGVRKAGHAGTLDPFATGLLLVLVGRARRAQRFLMGLPKTYEAVARFGAVSTTGDPEGEIVETGTLPPDPLALPTGVVRQRPPAYSAVRIQGMKAYERARRGEQVEVPEREVTVYRFEQLWREGDRAGFAIECSSGTYVRSLIADLGDAYTTDLRRTSVGPFRVEDADPGEVIPLGDALAAVMPVVALEGEEARRAGHGVAVEREAQAPQVLLTDADGPIAIAEPRDGALLKPVVGFRA